MGDWKGPITNFFRASRRRHSKSDEIGGAQRKKLTFKNSLRAAVNLLIFMLFSVPVSCNHDVLYVNDGEDRYRRGED